MKLDKLDPPVNLDHDHVLGPSDAGALGGGIGFTISLFIAGLAFPNAADYAAAKIAIFIASVIAAVLGTIILYPRRDEESEPEVVEETDAVCSAILLSEGPMAAAGEVTRMTEKLRDQTTSSIAEVLTGLPKTSAWQERVYKEIHTNPELSFQETKTAALAATKLKEFGYEVFEGVGRTGVVGILRNGEGQTVLARADMDALPVRENTGLPYASTLTAVDDSGNTVNVAHACAHDAHVTCLLGAAELLANSRQPWGGTFIALFQPAEEVAGGAKAMVEGGLRDRIPKPDVAFAQHVLAYPAGKIGTQTGPVLSAGDSIRITLYGKGAHGSMPHNSVDPVVLAALVVLRLQTIVSRETKPGEFAVLTVGSSVAGSKSNIIPDRAVLLVNLRTYDMAVRQRMIESIERMVRAECEASGSPRPPAFEYFDQYPLTDNHHGVTDRITSAFRSHFGKETVFDLGRLTASEDFSDIPNAFEIPYTYWGIGGTDPEKYQRALDAGRVEQDIPVNHSEFFAPVIEPTLSTGTQALVIAALTYLVK